MIHVKLIVDDPRRMKLALEAAYDATVRHPLEGIDDIRKYFFAKFGVITRRHADGEVWVTCFDRT